MDNGMLLAAAGDSGLLVSLYWIGLIVGGGSLLFSTVLGGHADGAASDGLDVDAQVDTESGFDHAHGHPAGAGSLSSWLSLRFAIFFLAVFGLIGLTLTWLSDLAASTVLVVALVAGIGVGQFVHHILRHLRRTETDSSPRVSDYVNKLGRVTVSVQPPRMGEVALRVGRSDRYVPAASQRKDQSFKPGDVVAVVAYRDGVAEVISREEYEFLGDGTSGARNERGKG